MAWYRYKFQNIPHFLPPLCKNHYHHDRNTHHKVTVIEDGKHVDTDISIDRLKMQLHSTTRAEASKDRLKCKH